MTIIAEIREWIEYAVGFFAVVAEDDDPELWDQPRKRARLRRREERKRRKRKEKK